MTHQKILLSVLLLGKIFPENKKLKISLEIFYLIFNVGKITLLKVAIYAVFHGFLFVWGFGILFASSWLY
jgi:hypothetical protein